MKNIMTTINDINEASFIKLKKNIKNALLDLEGGFDKPIWVFDDFKNNFIFAGITRLFFNSTYNDSIDMFEEIPSIKIMIPCEIRNELEHFIKKSYNDLFYGCTFNFRNNRFYITYIDDDIQIQLPLVLVPIEFENGEISKWDILTSNYTESDFKNKISEPAYFELLKAAVEASTERDLGILIDNKGQEIFCENVFNTKELTENGLVNKLTPVNKSKDIWKKSLSERVSKDINELYFTILKEPLIETNQLLPFSSFTGLVSLLKEKDEHFRNRVLKIFESKFRNKRLRESKSIKDKTIQFLENNLL